MRPIYSAKLKLLGCLALLSKLLISAIHCFNHLSFNRGRLIKMWTPEDCQRGGNISSDSFLPSILLLVVIIVTVVIVVVILIVIVVVIDRVVVVVGGVSSILKLLFLIIGWAYAFHQDKASSVRVRVANVTLSSSAYLLRENTDSGVDNRRITLIVIRARANSAVVVSLMEFVLVVLMEMEIKSIFQLRTLLINLQFIYPEPDYSLDFNSPQDLHNLQQQNLCCENCRGPHATIECQPMSQNSHSFGFDQLQTPQFSVNHQPPQPMSMEALQAQEDLMKSIESFLKKFNRISFGKTPKVLLQAWDNFFEVKHAQSEEVQELLSKLVQDVKIISDELSEYINTPAWNRPLVYCDNDDDEDYTIAITPESPTKEPVNSLSLGDEHLDTIPATESDEFIKSSVENLVPTPIEFEDFSDDECDLPPYDDSSKNHDFTFSNPLFDIDEDFTLSDESFSEEDIPKENFIIFSNPLFDLDEEIASTKVDRINDEVLEGIHSIPPGIDSFDAESDLVESVLNRDISIDSSPKIDSLSNEFAGELILPKSIPPEIEEVEFDPEGDILFLEYEVHDGFNIRMQLSKSTWSVYINPPSGIRTLICRRAVGVTVMPPFGCVLSMQQRTSRGLFEVGVRKLAEEARSCLAKSLPIASLHALTFERRKNWKVMTWGREQEDAFQTCYGQFRECASSMSAYRLCTHAKRAVYVVRPQASRQLTSMKSGMLADCLRVPRTLGAVVLLALDLETFILIACNMAVLFGLVDAKRLLKVTIAEVKASNIACLKPMTLTNIIVDVLIIIFRHSLLLTSMCYDDAYLVMPRDSALAGCDTSIKDVKFDSFTFTNPFDPPETSSAESSSSRIVDTSNMHTFHQPHSHIRKLTKYSQEYDGISDGREDCFSEGILKEEVYNPRGIFINQSKYALEMLNKYNLENNDAVDTPVDIGFDLTAFADADHAGCQDTRRSTSGNAQFLSEKLVSWSSNKQKCTAISTTEAKYISLSG
ncbi:hypothetical protein Tco_0858224 [Tanacetum coccineum]|uniref:Reverse transcriptase Ty1/copia-type domain-containing protein n=1 Tax=Tanacetum coccineum TaxID=301880 RepID=A0ABQ5BB95_9ASTR